MSRRTTSWLVTGALVLLVVATIATLRHLGGATAASGQPSGASATRTVSPQLALQEGVDLHGTPAPNFTLTDQHGASLSLAQMRGHIVVLTFFDSLCPHAECTLMAQYLAATASDLGPQQTGQLSWMALTVNPWHDTPASVTTFLTSRQVNWPFHYMLGTPQQMIPIWNDYHMQVIPPDANGIVEHTTGIYVIDAQGRERLYMDEGFDPQVLSAYLSSLLKQPANAPITSGTPAANQQPANVFEQTQKAGDKTIVLTAAPGKFGTYTFTATIEQGVGDSQGVPVQAATVTADLTMPGMPMEPLSVTLKPMSPPVPGAYQAQNVLSMKGTWHVIVKVQTQGMAQPVSATFVFNAQF